MKDYYIFADESNFNKGQYRSVGAIVINERCLDVIDTQLKYILNQYNINNITSFKWAKIQSDNKFNALKYFLIFLFPFLEKRLVTIHTLTWDTYDSRHDVEHRDDTENLSIMYYNLIKDITSKKLVCQESLKIYPDQNNSMDWEYLQMLLRNNSTKYDYNNNYIIDSHEIYIKESSTEKHNLIQIADIFAGIARTSYEDYDDYEFYNPQQTRLVPLKKISRRQKYRFEIYNIIKKWGEDHKYQISINSKRGFNSFNQYAPINFWFYTPQRFNDKAPTKFGKYG